MSGGNMHDGGALMRTAARATPHYGDGGRRRHLALVRPERDRTQRDRAEREQPEREEPGRGGAPQPSANRVGSAVAGPTVMAGAIAFAGHLLALDAVGLDRFGELVLVHSIALVVIGFAGLGLPGMIRAEHGTSGAHAAGGRLAHLPVIAIAISVAIVAGAATALAGRQLLPIAALFSIAAAARVVSSIASAALEHSGDYRSGTASILGASVIWLAVVIAAIEFGAEWYALAMAAAIAEVVRAVWSWLTVGDAIGLASPSRYRSTSLAHELGRSLRFVASGDQRTLITTTGLVVVGALGSPTDLGLVALVAVLVRFAIALEPAIDALGPVLLASHPTMPTTRAWRLAARLADATALPVAIIAVAAFAIGPPAFAQIGGIDAKTAVVVAGLVLAAALATHLLRVADLALRATGRHLVANAIIAARVAAIGGLGSVGYLLASSGWNIKGVAWLAAAWAATEWVTVAAVIMATSWRPFDQPTIATLLVLGVVGVGLIAADASSWDATRLALSLMLVGVLAASVARIAARSRRIDTIVARRLGERAEATH